MSNHVAGEAHASPALLASAPPAFFPLEPGNEEDQDTDDVSAGVDEDALNHDELDTDQVASTD